MNQDMKNFAMALSMIFLFTLSLNGCGGGSGGNGTNPDKGSISGTVTDTLNGRSIPVTGATITVGSLTVRTGDDGSYTLTDLTPGSVSAIMTAAQYQSQTVSASVTAGSTTTGVNFTTYPVVPAHRIAYGSQGAGVNELDEPHGICAANGKIYITDYGNHRVKIFDPQTSTFTNFGSSGSADGQFQYPFGIISDTRYLYISDCNNNAVKVYDFTGVYQRKITLTESTSSTAWYPRGMDWDTNGLLYVVGADTCQINSYPGAATVLSMAGENLMGLALDNKRNKMYVTTIAGIENELVIFTRTGTTWGSRQNVTDLPDDDVGSIYPTGLYLDSNGYLWFADPVRNRVVKLSPSGKFIMEIDVNQANALTYDAAVELNTRLLGIVKGILN